jgi:hypothetical protein
MVLASDVAAVLARLAASGAPLDGVGDWYDAHEGDFRSSTTTDVRLRAAVRDALAVCFERRRLQLSDAAARRELQAIAERLRSPSGRTR